MGIGIFEMFEDKRHFVATFDGRNQHHLSGLYNPREFHCHDAAHGISDKMEWLSSIYFRQKFADVSLHRIVLILTRKGQVYRVGYCHQLMPENALIGSDTTDEISFDGFHYIKIRKYFCGWKSELAFQSGGSGNLEHTVYRQFGLQAQFFVHQQFR